MKIAVILGTRPEAIKLAPVILALKAVPGMKCTVCVTGQHRQMLDPVLEIFGITADFDCNLMEPNQTLARLTGRAIEAIDEYLTQDRPDLVVAQGDTTTVLCAALAAFYLRTPLAHVEAGLRTWDPRAPWPEEVNRVLTTRLAALHFAPTETARQNLWREGVPDSRIVVTGNTVIDALYLALKRVRLSPPEIPSLPFLSNGPVLPSPLVLITGHRRENFGQGFDSICQAVAELARRFPNAQFVYPVHLNPNVREPVQRTLRTNGGAHSAILKNVHLIDPLPYLPFVALMDRATLILTDSGGVQEEAPSLGKPVLVMRDTTERPEAVEAGTVKLVGTDFDTIVKEVSRLLTDRAAYEVMARAHNPYGDGEAAGRIVRACCDFISQGEFRG
jgi:UDP-N-acetylglucosamine 2-epimerase (non-hydrolysing)